MKQEDKEGLLIGIAVTVVTLLIFAGILYFLNCCWNDDITNFQKLQRKQFKVQCSLDHGQVYDYKQAQMLVCKKGDDVIHIEYY